MWDRFFKRKKEPSPPPHEDWEAKLVWLPVGHGENPFQEEVLDCRSVALSFTSLISDKSVAESFSRLRASDGSEIRGQLPEPTIAFDCDLRFAYNGSHDDGPLFVAPEMEDKWDFYAYDGRLYVRRSWTGLLTHVAEVEYAPDVLVVRRIHCHPDTVFADRDFAMAQLQFLIATHLGRTLAPFPIGVAFPREAQKPSR